jgi:hypothetical protein
VAGHFLSEFFGMKSLLRFAATRISVPTYERLLAHSVLKDNFDSLSDLPVFEKREDLWTDCVTKRIKSTDKITFVEFGVHTGYSIEYFAEKNTNKDSVFIGLDSFEGLPESWGTMAKGSFDVKGAIPKTDDPRVSFIKGWFHYTWAELASKLSGAETLIVHYDADLYSSTLFALSKIDTLNRPYIAIFDEFAGHEARALHNYVQSHAAKVLFLGKTVAEGYPVHVMCRVVPPTLNR